jgi:tripartite-type tricarboxylate transporter receptor subunit TctC
MQIRRHAFLVAFLVVFLAVLTWLPFISSHSFAAAKEDFPKKPITFISGWPGGGGGDQEIRGFALYLKKYLPVSTVIENVPGAATKIALTKAWKAKPDGYTMVYVTPPQQILNEFMSKTEYTTKEFVPVYSFFKRSFAMTVNGETWKTAEEFVRAAKTRTMSIGLSSFGSVAHITALSAAKIWGITPNWVPFESGTGAVTQVAGKHLDAAFTAATTALPLMRGGKIRALLRFSDTPLEGFENVPDPAEAGYPIPIISGLGGILAPPKTPANVVKIIEDAAAKTAKDPEFLNWAAKAQYEVIHLSSDGFRKKLLDQYKIVEENMPMIRASMEKR